MRYYVKISGKAFGPFPEEKLGEMIQQSRIKRETEVSTDGKEWVSAERAGLFGASPTEAGNIYGVADGGASGINLHKNTVPEWYLSHDGKSGTGPYATAEIESMIISGAAAAGALIWRQGENARPLAKEPLFAASFRSGSGSRTALGAPTQGPPDFNSFSNNASYSPTDVGTWGNAGSSPLNERKRKLTFRFVMCWVSLAADALLFLISFMMMLIGTADESTGVFVLGGIFFQFLCVASVVTFYIFFLMLLSGMWQTVDPHLAQTTPGKAIGFLFIPFFNCYWIFVAIYGLAVDLNKTLRARGAAPAVSEGMALTTCILALVPCLNLVSIIILFISLNQMKKAACQILDIG